MENLAKQTLQNELDQLKEKQQILYSIKYEELVSKVKGLIKEALGRPVSEVRLYREEIDIYLEENRQYHFRILQRTRYDFKAEVDVKQTPTIGWSGSSEANLDDLVYITIVGDLAKKVLENTPAFNDIIFVMDDLNEFERIELKSGRKQISELEKAIRNIEDMERNNEFEKVFKQGFIENEDGMRLRIGNGRFDRITSKKFAWVENPGGKTFTMKYFTKHANEEVVGYDIGKRLKKDDLIAFIKSNITK